MADWNQFRSQFPVTSRLVYMNHAAVSPLPKPCVERMQTYLTELSMRGAARYPGVIADTLAEVRDRGARLLGTQPDRVFIVRSTTQGLGIVATGLHLRAGDNVVIADREFPANVRPWLPLARRGVEVRRLAQPGGRIDLDELKRRVDDRTAAVSLSFVQFLSGFRLQLEPVAELCRAHDALFVVDGIQGVGAFPIDVEAQGVDFLSADAHKWMVAPEGVGLGYASPRAMERIEPALEGWLSVIRPFDFFDLEQPLKPTPARFEEGAYNTAGLHGLAGSLALLEEAGIDNIAKRIIELTDLLAEELQGAGWEVLSPRTSPGEKSGIVLTTRAGADFTALQSRLSQEGIVASIRGGALRLAPHAYNTEDEVRHVVATLD